MGTGGEGSSGYRAWLDGLRAVAVYLVVVFHAGVGGFAGGFVGVDVFFVLSGFLVTGLLLKDVGDGSGRPGLSRFYARRFRRLLPAAFVVLLVTGAVFAAVASPVEISDAVGGFKAAFLYVTNWYFIAQSTDYFGAELTANPVLHFWSLAVEEQFYLVWPLLLGGLFWVSRRLGAWQWRAVQTSVLVIAVSSLTWALVLRTSNPSRAYYGTDTRAYQLMAGALLALTPGLLRRLSRFDRAARWIGPVAIAALVLVASSTLRSLDAIERGVAATVVTVVILVCLETGQGGPLRWCLSRPTAVYLGKISYGIYLWHWPVALLMTRTFDLSAWSTAAYTSLIATGLASLSYHLLEHPIRLSSFLERHRAPVIAVGLATSIVSALVLIPAIVDPTPTTAAPTNAKTTGFTPVPNLDYAAIKSDEVPWLPGPGDESPIKNCLDQAVRACTIVHGTGLHVLVIGDSNAAMLIPAFKILADAHDLTLSEYVGCPWQRELFSGQTLEGRARCTRLKDDLYDRVIPALDPDIVVTMNAGYEQSTSFLSYLGQDDAPLPKRSQELAQWIDATTSRSLATLRDGGSKVVLLEPIPFAGERFDPLSCLSAADVVEECRYVAGQTPTGVEDLYRRLDDQDDQVWAADIDRLVCPFLPICDPIVDGQVVKFDAGHLTRSYSETLAPALGDFLVSNGILPR